MNEDDSGYRCSDENSTAVTKTVKSMPGIGRVFSSTLNAGF